MPSAVMVISGMLGYGLHESRGKKALYALFVKADKNVEFSSDALPAASETRYPRFFIAGMPV